MASPHHRHQSSLEGVLDFSSPQPLEPDQRNRATDIFNQIVAQYEPCQTDDKDYKRITLLRVAHDSVISRDNFLSCFFLFVEKELRQGEDVSEPSLSQALSRYVNPRVLYENHEDLVKPSSTDTTSWARRRPC
jgi:hypothetical protein